VEKDRVRNVDPKWINYRPNADNTVVLYYAPGLVVDIGDTR